jgi:2-polyprenyl-6-methoxyphenol hydroxylase-like FAD-dependent oxidoreductase
METSMRTQVLIVGAGPVGLTAAMDLASRGIDVVVAEIRHAGDPPSVKCNHVSARSMEVFRRLGVAAKLRDAGLPADFPNDCSYRTTATGVELCRIDIPSRARRYSATGGPDTWWPTPEPPHRINQVYLEPILFSHAAAQPRITILSRRHAISTAERRAASKPVLSSAATAAVPSSARRSAQPCPARR